MPRGEERSSIVGSVKAICMAEHFDMNALYGTLVKSRFHRLDLLGDGVLRIVQLDSSTSCASASDQDPPLGKSRDSGAGGLEAFFFTQGCVVLWGEEPLFEAFLRSLQGAMQASQRDPLLVPESETLFYQRRISESFRASMSGELILIESPSLVRDARSPDFKPSRVDLKAKNRAGVDKNGGADCSIVDSLPDAEIKAKIAFSNGLVDSSSSIPRFII
jgi:uncharacterized Rmd1/YagE family protein